MSSGSEAQTAMLSNDAIWKVLTEVADPELPVVNLVEMGIVREFAIESDQVCVTITPTFTGCPALHTMQRDIIERLERAGIDNVRVEVTLTPAWTTDWITDEAREKLRKFGLAPPPKHNGDFELILAETVTCPYCGSQNTILKNNWGPTPCRIMYYCDQCRQGFEQFKPL
jgi:ring-1,2-phenylacetyl-CoA epoxidase subunit PaaD